MGRGIYLNLTIESPPYSFTVTSKYFRSFDKFGNRLAISELKSAVWHHLRSYDLEVDLPSLWKLRFRLDHVIISFVFTRCLRSYHPFNLFSMPSLSEGESAQNAPALGNSRRVSLVPIGVHQEGEQPGNDAALGDEKDSGEEEGPFARYSLSSYRHPHDISPPNYAYSGNHQYLTREISPHDTGFANIERPSPDDEQKGRRQSILTGVMDWYSPSGGHMMDSRASESSEDFREYHGKSSRMRRDDSAYSECSIGSDMLEPDDPRMTGRTSKQLDDQDDLEKNTLRLMDYKTRRKHIQRIRIQFNISCQSFRGIAARINQ